MVNQELAGAMPLKYSEHRTAFAFHACMLRPYASYVKFYTWWGHTQVVEDYIKQHDF